MKALTIGISEPGVCGVRDHSRILDRELAHRGWRIVREWWNRSASHQSVAGLHAAGRRWRSAVAGALARGQPDVVVWHYSVFSHAWRGMPTLVPATASLLGQGPAPVLAFLHEYAYPWGRRGWRGVLWAASQRAVLPTVVGAADALMTTLVRRAEWLSSCAWLPDRPVRAVPVFSNLPDIGPVETGNTLTVGVFGYSAEHAPVELIVEALTSLRAHVPDAHLCLLGAPGEDSGAGARWCRAAARSGWSEQALRFTGVLDAGELARAIRACHLVLFADPGGPSARKGTLAAALAAARPVVALDGPDTWAELRAQRVVRVVPPNSSDIAAALSSLARCRDERRALGKRARSFYEQRQHPSIVTEQVADLLSDVATTDGVTT